MEHNPQWLSWWFIAGGLALPVVWDGIHYGERRAALVPTWYSHFCAVFELVIALFITVFYALGIGGLA